jgi:hypothetical protein
MLIRRYAPEFSCKLTNTERLSVLLPVNLFPLPSLNSKTTVPVATLDAELGYCKTAAGSDIIAKAKGLIAKTLLLTEADKEETVKRYESPLSKETENVNEATPEAAVEV